MTENRKPEQVFSTCRLVAVVFRTHSTDRPTDSQRKPRLPWSLFIWGPRLATGTVNSDTPTTRRRFLQATGAAAGAAALAGCSGGSGDSGGDNTGTGIEGGAEDSGNAETTAGTESAGETDTAGGDDTAGTDADQGTESGDDGGSTGGTLNLVNASMTSLDPVAASDTASSEVTTRLFDGLMHFPDGGLPVEPLLATGYEISDDYLTYTFTLKEGAQFHSGTGVTADDFVYAYERLAGSANS